MSQSPTTAPRSSPTASVATVKPEPTAVVTVKPEPTAVVTVTSEPTTPSSTQTPASTPTPRPEATSTRTTTPGAQSSSETPTPQPSASPEQDPTEQDPTDQEAATTEEAALDWHAFVPSDTADHLATMERAARESGCGVPWQLLAAIARIESDFGRNMATSSAGAIGYGQFLPSSWQAFGSDGNVYDYRDALPAMALYLCEAGLARDPRTALFAYNHAEWYVDLVLDLAVRYDRIAPGEPIPEVLSVGPLADAGAPMHYAPGRDVRLQSKTRRLEAGTSWLGVPWHGRTPGTPISPPSLEDTTLEMLRGAFAVSGKLPGHSTPDAQGFGDLADRAWSAGLLPLPADSGPWTIEAIRAHLDRGQPVVALVDARALPGHPPTEASGDQPVLVIGTTADGLILSDPTFSSSLGYGLQLSDTEFLAAWQSASSPRRALAYSVRPKPLARQAHVRTAEPPPLLARVLPTATPVPTMLVEPTPPPALSEAEVAPAPPVAGAAASTEDGADATRTQPTNDGADATRTQRTEERANLSWMLPATAGTLFAIAIAIAIAIAFGVRLRRARRSGWRSAGGATAPPRSGQ